MKRQLYLLSVIALISLLAAACESIAPPPPPTPVPTDTPVPAPTATVTPTPGPREYIDAVYCWPSNIDAGSFGLLRFFGNGAVLDVSVAPFADCQEAWDQMKQYLTIENTMTFNHGEYYLSEGIIRFELAKAQSNTIVGEVTGTLERNKMILTKQGAAYEYVLVTGGP